MEISDTAAAMNGGTVATLTIFGVPVPHIIMVATLVHLALVIYRNIQKIRNKE